MLAPVGRLMYRYRGSETSPPAAHGVAARCKPKGENGLLAGQMRRTLTVILASDVAGYSRLVAADEEDTVHRFQQAASAFADQVRQHHGRIFNTAGDAILAKFDSAVDATRCAMAIQDANNAGNAAVPQERKLMFRIGIAIGDVMVAEDGDLLGDGVNIAARLEGIAEPGGICVSEEVRAHVLNKIDIGAIDLGEQTLKNIPRPVRAFRLTADPENAPLPQAKPVRRSALGIPLSWAASAAAVLVLAISVVLLRPQTPSQPPPVAQLPPAQQAAVQPGATQPASLANADTAFDAGSVPLVTDRVRASLANYAQEPDFKAIAISRIGWGVASGAADLASAERDALDRCKKRDPKGDCRVYAAGGDVVWRRSPLPGPADLHDEPLDLPLVPAELAGLMGGRSLSALEAYLAEKNHKALAITEAGYSAMGDRTSQKEAIRLAVERCSDFARAACLLVSVDGFLTVKIPHARAAARPYTLAGESEMSGADKQRIGQIYSGKDWRALVKGGPSHWYAVKEAESESAAVDQALEACRKVEPDCTLRAIGNFRVDEKP
jgi:class 3 adenylate cyclase